MKNILAKSLLTACILSVSTITHAEIINFDDLTLSQNSYWNGSDESGLFTSNKITYYNEYHSDYAYYYGATYSNVSSYKTGALNKEQYTSSTLGGLSRDGTTSADEIYSIVYVEKQYSMFATSPMVDLSDLSTPINSIYLSNTAYVTDILTSEKYPSNWARPFTDGDYLKLTIYGYDQNADEIGTVDFYLADFRDGKTYIATDWTAVDLSKFGGNAKYLNFSLESTDSSTYGMNTPSYIAIGGFDTAAIPEPADLATAFALLATLVAIKMRSKRN